MLLRLVLAVFEPFHDLQPFKGWASVSWKATQPPLGVWQLALASGGSQLSNTSRSARSFILLHHSQTLRRRFVFTCNTRGGRCWGQTIAAGTLSDSWSIWRASLCKCPTQEPGPRTSPSLARSSSAPPHANRRRINRGASGDRDPSEKTVGGWRGGGHWRSSAEEEEEVQSAESFSQDAGGRSVARTRSCWGEKERRLTPKQMLLSTSGQLAWQVRVIGRECSRAPRVQVCDAALHHVTLLSTRS